MFGINNNGLCYIKGKFYNGNIVKTTIHFTITPLQNVMVKTFGNHNLSVLYSNLCYNGVYYNECKQLATAQTSLFTCTV